jgi:hypothetical protein
MLEFFLALTIVIGVVGIVTILYVIAALSGILK